GHWACGIRPAQSAVRRVHSRGLGTHFHFEFRATPTASIERRQPVSCGAIRCNPNSRTGAFLKARNALMPLGSSPGAPGEELCMMLMRIVRGVIAWRTASGSTRPYVSTGRYVRTSHSRVDDPPRAQRVAYPGG